MHFSDNYKRGILMQGRISDWTTDIVREYQKNFPYTSILVSTWTKSNVEEIPCEVIQIDPPAQTYPHLSTINHQIIGARAGLEKMQCDIIMKCRTDQFIHNRDIFKIFEDSCPKHKIMVPHEGLKLSDYYLSDFCQVATRSVLLNYWNSIPLYDGSYAITPEIYLTRSYVVDVMKDNRPWEITTREYFCPKGYEEDFQIEWEKLVKFDSYQKGFRKKRSKDVLLPYHEYVKLINE